MNSQPGLIDECAEKTSAPLIFKVASEDWEFEQVHTLNYKTFVEEIPQHEANPDGLLTVGPGYQKCTARQKKASMPNGFSRHPVTACSNRLNRERLRPGLCSE